MKKRIFRTICLILSFTAVMSVLFVGKVFGYKPNTSLGLLNVVNALNPAVVEKGIDISEWQGDVNFVKVKNAGNSFVILRAGIPSGIDENFEKYYTDARAAGLKVGCYFFSYALSAAEATTEAKKFLNYMGNRQFDYPVYMDFEYEKLLKLSKSQRTAIINAFIDILQAKKYYTGVYCHESWCDDSIIDATNIGKTSCFWVADFSRGESSIPYLKKKAGMWQYDIGTVPGINADVDLNYSFVDYAPIIKNNGYNNYKIPTCKVTFDPNGGAVGTTEKQVKHNEKYGTLPVPTWDNHMFTGWFTQAIGGELCTAETVVSNEADHTLYAHWQVVQSRITDVKLDDTTLRYKSTGRLEPKIAAIGSIGFSVQYSSSDESVVKVDGDGKITALKTGKSIIRCIVIDDNGNVVNASCTVTVTIEWWQVLLKAILYNLGMIY